MYAAGAWICCDGDASRSRITGPHKMVHQVVFSQHKTHTSDTSGLLSIGYSMIR
jgi:hypothetical protein